MLLDKQKMAMHKKEKRNQFSLLLMRSMAMGLVFTALFIGIMSNKIVPNNADAQCVAVLTNPPTGCVWVYGPTTHRPNWSVAPCPAGKTLRGFGCQWSNNQQQQEEFEAGPDYFQCRYVNDGSVATARAYCCDS